MAFSVIFERLHRSLTFKTGTVRALTLIGVSLMLFHANRVQRTVIFGSGVMHALAHITTDATVDLFLLHDLTSLGS